jgi:DUF971 family protein
MATETRPEPVEMTIDSPNGVMRITWNDGRRCEIGLDALRKACPCATCNEERAKPPDPFRIFTPAQLGTAKVAGAEQVGLYAIRISWRDGHDTGIYSWEFLREMCPAP